MKRCHFLCFFCVHFLACNFNIAVAQQIDSKFPEQSGAHYGILTDSTWQVNPIAKLGDPAPGTGGKYLDFNSYRPYHLLKSGELIFVAQLHGDKKNKYWGHYSYKKGKPELILVEGTTPDRPVDVTGEVEYIRAGYNNQFYSTGNRYYLSAGGAYIAMWNGNALSRVVSKGDNITLPGGRSAVIDYSVVVRVTNENAVIYFITSSADKISGWLVHDGVNLKPLFLQKKENLPGTTGITDVSIKTFYGYPYISDDTVLVILTDTDNQLRKSSIFRFTKDKTEKILGDDDPHPLFPDIKINNPQAFNIQHSQKFLVTGIQNAKKFLTKENQTLLYYNHGLWKSIIEDVKELPESKGFDKYSIDGSLFLGQKKDTILFSISLVNEEGIYPNTYVAGRLPLLLLYDGNKLINIPWYADLNGVSVLEEFNPKKNSFVPIRISKIAEFNNLIIKIPWYVLADRKNLPQDFSLGNYLLDPADKDLKLRNITQLKTKGSNSFTPASIIGWLDAKRVVAKSGALDQVTGFFELSLQ